MRESEFTMGSFFEESEEGDLHVIDSDLVFVRRGRSRV